MSRNATFRHRLCRMAPARSARRHAQSHRHARAVRRRSGALRALQRRGGRPGTGFLAPAGQCRGARCLRGARRGAAAARNASRRCSAATRSTAPRAARCCTPRCAAPARSPLIVEGTDVNALVQDERERVLGFAEAVRGGQHPFGSSGAPFSLVVNIGIGGSDLGPAMAVEALRPYAARCAARRLRLQRRWLPARRPHRGRRSGPHAVHHLLEDLHDARDADQRARGARLDRAATLGEAAVPAAFCRRFGQRAGDGRVRRASRTTASRCGTGSAAATRSGPRSASSLAIAIGRSGFEAFLAGGREIDEHFRAAPWSRNLPVLAGLLGVWNIDLLRPADAGGAALRLPARAPAGLPAAARDGEQRQARHASMARPTTLPTCPVIWGEPGNNAQHSFFQLLHQGTPRAALDFLLPINSSGGSPGAAGPRDRECPGAGRGLCVRPGCGRGTRRPRRARSCPRRGSRS